MRALVVGYGSIGARHARILQEEGCAVGVVSRRAVDVSPCYTTVAEGVHGHRPDYVVVANRTVEHRPALESLAAAGFEGTVLVEKPLFQDPCPVPKNAFARLLVAYNLRFHPGVQRLRAALRGERVLSVQAYAGQYLPAWRPGRDYREVYSSHKVAGGGVLRDLSHELDYLNWMLGGWTRATAIGGTLSTLEIDSEDTAVVLAAFRDCPAASIQLNYLDRPGRRAVLVNTDAATFELNLTEGYVQTDAGAREPFTVGRDDTYRAQHRAILSGEAGDVCTAPEALDVLRLIEAAEMTLDTPRWVTR